MVHRGEFEVEWNNDAEWVIKDIIFNDDDTPEELDIKYKMLEVYYSTLEERGRRRKFVIDKGLLDSKKDRRRVKGEKDVFATTRPLLQILDTKVYEEYVKGLLHENAVRERIRQLREYRLNGIRTLAEAEMYELQKKKKDNDSSLRKSLPFDKNRRKSDIDSDLRLGRKAKALDIDGMPGLELLSEKEKQLCSTLRLSPKQVRPHSRAVRQFSALIDAVLSYQRNIHRRVEQQRFHQESKCSSTLPHR